MNYIPKTSGIIVTMMHALLYLQNKISWTTHASKTLLWRHNGHHGISKHQPHDCLLRRLFRRRSEKTSKLRVTGLCTRNSPVTSEFPTQMASNAENISSRWRHRDIRRSVSIKYGKILWNLILYFPSPIKLWIPFDWKGNTQYGDK